MKRIFISILSLVLVGTALTFSSCLKKDYDVPPNESGYDPNLTVTTTIAQLQTMPQSAITGDIVIAGIVCMDDRSGNYYKKIVIEDSTGGIEVHIDQANLYTDYPVGRKIYIKCKGLYLGSYHSLLQLGSAPDETGSITNINATTVGDYVVKADYPHTLKVDTLTYAQLKDPAQNAKRLNTLVAIKDVQFADADAGIAYCYPSASSSRRLATCSASGDIVLRSSNYANFQPILTPTGQGVIVGIYTRYDAAAQLTIRDTSDVHFYNPRCGAGGGGGSTEATLITIDSLRKMFTGATAVLDAVKISGVVISDRTTSNYQAQNLVMQQGSKGILIRFSSAHSYNLGDSITVSLSGASIMDYYGLLEISNVPNAGAAKMGTGTITPQVLTMQQINTNYETYESTLVKIANVTFPSGSFAGNKVISDGSGGSLTLYTAATATFGTVTMPTGTKTVTGVVGQYNTTKQLQINNPSTDIQ